MDATQTTLYPVLLLTLGMVLYSVSFRKLGSMGYGGHSERNAYIIGGVGLLALGLFELYLIQNNSSYTTILAVVSIILSIVFCAARFIFIDLFDLSVGQKMTPEQEPLAIIALVILLGGGIVALIA